MFEHTKFTDNFKPTIGADFSNKDVEIEGKPVTLQIWDTAGQERYQSLGTAFYRGADCCLLVYDITNQWSFDNLQSWKENFLKKSMVTQPDDFPLMVIGNKADLAEESRAVSQADAQDWCKKNGDHMFLETSASKNENVEAAFLQIATRALRRQEQMREKLATQMVNS
jgi:Ras-related protein Rab-7A